MKTNHLLYFLLLFLPVIYSSCEQSFVDNMDSNRHEKQLHIRQAQDYFESNATALRPLSFRETQPESRSLLAANLVPDWKQAAVSENEFARFVELPLRSGVVLSVKMDRYEPELGGTNRQRVAASRKLILSFDKSGYVNMFIVTLVPDAEYVGNKEYNPADFRFLGGSDFSGQVFCSKLDGTFMQVFLYRNGYMQTKLHVEKTVRKECGESNCSHDHASDHNPYLYATVNFSEIIRTRSFDSDEEESSCSYCTPGERCSVCGSNPLDEVTVTFCQRCNSQAKYNENTGMSKCNCCDICNAYPCKCNDNTGRCPYCNLVSCKGSCRTGGGSGGGTGGGGSSGGSGTNSGTLAKNIAATASGYPKNDERIYGSTPPNVDCSMFAQEVAKKHGKTLPRTTNGQQDWFKTNGTFVTNVSDVKVGDFMFWTGPNHVGIVIQISPKIKVVHATTNGYNKGSIKDTEVDSSGKINGGNGWPHRFVGAGRF